MNVETENSKERNWLQEVKMRDECFNISEQTERSSVTESYIGSGDEC